MVWFFNTKIECKRYNFFIVFIVIPLFIVSQLLAKLLHILRVFYHLYIKETVIMSIHIMNNCFNMLLHSVKKNSIKKKHDNEADETFVFILDRYHYKLKPSYRNFSKVFSIVSNYRLYLRVKTDKQMLFVFKIAFWKSLLLVLFISFSVDYGLCSDSYYGECVDILMKSHY